MSSILSFRHVLLPSATFPSVLSFHYHVSLCLPFVFTSHKFLTQRPADSLLQCSIWMLMRNRLLPQPRLRERFVLPRDLIELQCNGIGAFFSFVHSVVLCTTSALCSQRIHCSLSYVVVCHIQMNDIPILSCPHHLRHIFSLPFPPTLRSIPSSSASSKSTTPT